MCGSRAGEAVLFAATATDNAMTGMARIVNGSKGKQVMQCQMARIVNTSKDKCDIEQRCGGENRLNGS